MTIAPALARSAHPRRATLAVVALLAAACAPARTPPAAVVAPVSAFRVHDSSRSRDATFDAMIADLARADVIFIGEQHDDPATHALELAILDGVSRRRDRVVLALEMFERDVQPLLAEYLAGRLPEADFLARSRPWPRYATDYRPLVELASRKGWPVVAGNVPRRLASLVARAGLAGLDTVPPSDRPFLARELRCETSGRYYDRFVQTMTGHGGPADSAGDAARRATTDRFYAAQCVKDETMAESVVTALRDGGAGTLVVHVNGAFHSDFALGTAERVKRRRPDARIVVVTAVPVADPAAEDPAPVRAQGDYVVFTRRR